MNRIAPPVSGSYSAGDLVWNSAPSPGGNIGWVFTAGTQGAWKSVREYRDLIQGDRGAFIPYATIKRKVEAAMKCQDAGMTDFRARKIWSFPRAPKGL
jgi:hypothetical protein